ncbi:MAG TPA: mechanosensitive ion channel domain-containing protein, partial [Rhodothermales bacterium]|nr:mechanosensitive ion channel domain-containing protein [Rhodothermales bacterium]
SLRYRGYKIIERILGVLVVGVLVLTWAPVRRDMVTLFTVVGTGLAIATREALMSILGWLHLTIRAPYRQGDRIEINGLHGDVVDIRLLHTTLVEVGKWVEGEQSTGRLVHVPNNWVILHPVINDTHGFGFVWNEFSVTLTHESDWKAAQALMERLAREISPEVEARAQANLRALAPHFLVQYSILSPFVYVRVDEHGIRLTLRHLCEVRRRRGVEHALTVRMLEGFAEHGGIKLAVK